MADDTVQMLGLIGFIIAGAMFVGVGIRFGDPLTVAGSAVWIVSCMIWMIPLLRRRSGSGGED